MKHLAAFLIGVVLPLWLPVRAESQTKPPSKEKIQELLQKEPIAFANWNVWSGRLLTWGERNATRPAYDAARKFFKGQANTRGELPGGLDRDALAWLLLGDAYLKTGTQPSPRDLEAAEKALRQCLKLQPNFPWASYDLGRSILLLEFGGKDGPRPERLKEGRQLMHKARELDPNMPVLSPLDEGNIALRLEEYAEAEKHLRQAVGDKPEDLSAAKNYAKAVVYNPERKEPRAPAIQPLTQRFPNEGYLAAMHGGALALDGDRTAADKEYERARGLGTEPAKFLPPNEANNAEIKAPPSFVARLAHLVIGFILFYAFVIAFMAGAGLVMARFTRGPGALQLLDKPPEKLVAQSQVVQTFHETWLNRLYGLTLMTVLILFYAAFPFIITGMLFSFCFVLVLGMLMHQQDDSTRMMHGHLLRASGGGLWSVFRCLFVGFRSGSFGVVKSSRQCPGLHAVITEVARRVDTEPVDEIYLAPGAEMSVHQEGRGPFGMFGNKKRVLTVGLSTLMFLTVEELKAILAHEYAHFSHHDTLYNRFIAQVSLTMREVRRGITQSGGLLTYINPFYWFFYLYSVAYGLLSSGFSRSREFLADRMACSLYGADVFVSGLNKVITEGTLFEIQIYENVAERLGKGKAFVNMYEAFRTFRQRQFTPEERSKLNKKLLNEKPSVFASHPTFAERVAAVQSLPKSAQPNPKQALSLLEDPVAVEKELTDFLTDCMSRARR